MMKKIALLLCLGWMGCAGTSQEVHTDNTPPTDNTQPKESLIEIWEKAEAADFYKAKRTLYQLGAPWCYSAVECSRKQLEIIHPGISLSDAELGNAVETAFQLGERYNKMTPEQRAQHRERLALTLTPRNWEIAIAYGQMSTHYHNNNCIVDVDPCPAAILKSEKLTAQQQREIQQGLSD